VSQEALAHECGMGRTYLSGVERSERNVSIDRKGTAHRSRGSCSGTTEPGGGDRFRARRPLSKQVPPWRSQKLAAVFDPLRPSSANLFCTANVLLFDHLVGAQQNRWGYGKAERLGGLEVQDHLEFCRQLDGKLRRLRAA
jgi:Helix-turn-helix